MEWSAKIHRKALKYLQTLPLRERRRVEEKIEELLQSLNRGTIPYTRLDIKRLRGEWEGFFRLRIGDIRVIFRINIDRKEILIYNIHHRSKAYN